MSDLALQALRRQAAAGDRDALDPLWAAEERAGLGGGARPWLVAVMAYITTRSGYGDGDGYGYGYGDGKEIDMRVSGFTCHIFPPWPILKIGCEVHALEHWRKNWQSIADRSDVEVDEKEIYSAIAAAEAVIGG